MNKILVIEDEENIRGFILVNLKRFGYQVFEAESAEDGLKIYEQNEDISVILLDVMLPGMDGFQACQQIREKDQSVGIIMLTAKTQEMDKVHGLMNGADDYVIKPFSPNELVARVQSLMRRMRSATNSSLKNETHGVKVDLQKRIVKKDGVHIDLSPIEFSVLELLVTAQGSAISRNDLLDEVWGLNFAGDPKVVDVNIRRIRQKIEYDPSNPKMIETVWGFGYRWNDKGLDTNGN
ncbi:response regulator transcription factor [Falsibacillus albus]|uniref:DNA-binding response regulator n=1 Tax=Falsibacillus albus TaxID=2478915 RepID=A0A3L7JYI8_9BACI|nr:response regulator transcription factor [Falsibacillus albus]RLQ95355.1 DNA-binding response regulator [Falsibacillus albus]